MNKKQLEKFRELLLNRQRELLSDAGASSEAIDELQSFPTADWVDRASVDNAVSSMIARESGLAKELEDIKDALIKIEKGTYGICKQCGKEINLERLEAIPTARLCRECKQQEERNMQRGEDFRGSGNIPKEVFEWYE